MNCGTWAAATIASLPLLELLLALLELDIALLLLDLALLLLDFAFAEELLDLTLLEDLALLELDFTELLDIAELELTSGELELIFSSLLEDAATLELVLAGPGGATELLDAILELLTCFCHFGAITKFPDAVAGISVIRLES